MVLATTRFATTNPLQLFCQVLVWWWKGALPSSRYGFCHEVPQLIKIRNRRWCFIHFYPTQLGRPIDWFPYWNFNEHQPAFSSMLFFISTRKSELFVIVWWIKGPESSQVLGKPDVFVRCALARPFPKNWPNKTAKLQLKASKIDNLRNKLVHGAGNLETNGGIGLWRTFWNHHLLPEAGNLRLKLPQRKEWRLIPYFWVPCSVVSRRDFLASPFSPWDLLGFSCYVSWIWSSTEELSRTLEWDVAIQRNLQPSPSHPA